MLMLKNITRALRLPFVTVSALPFIFGSLLAKDNFSLIRFLLGFIAVMFTHLSANLMNDYCDSKSGADWQDRAFYGFFGGSKLIQEGVLSEAFYRNTALFLAVLAVISISALSFIMGDLVVIFYFFGIFFLAWAYSVKPLQLSYRKIGEPVIFVLFGPALVMGGYFIQTKIFPTTEGFLLSLPFGLLTTAILFINEIPDFPLDKKSGKNTWVTFFGPERSCWGYAVLVLSVFVSIIVCILLGYLSYISLVSLFFLVMAPKAFNIVKNYPRDKNKLIESSRIAISSHAFVSITLILGVIL